MRFEVYYQFVAPIFPLCALALCLPACLYHINNPLQLGGDEEQKGNCLILGTVFYSLGFLASVTHSPADTKSLIALLVCVSVCICPKNSWHFTGFI